MIISFHLHLACRTTNETEGREQRVETKVSLTSIPGENELDVEHIGSSIAKNSGFCFRSFRRFVGMKVGQFLVRSIVPFEVDVCPQPAPWPQGTHTSLLAIEPHRLLSPVAHSQ